MDSIEEGEAICISMQKISMAKSYCREKGILQKLPTDREWWEKFVEYVNLQALLERIEFEYRGE